MRGNAISRDLFEHSDKRFTLEEEIELVRKYRAGDSEAGGLLVSSVMPWITRTCAKISRPVTVDLEDVVSEIVVVLLKAIRENFDPNLSRLMSFATHVITCRGKRIVHKLSGKFDTENAPDGFLEAEITSRDEYDPSCGLGLDGDDYAKLLDAILKSPISPDEALALMDKLEGLSLRSIAARIDARSKSQGVTTKRSLPYASKLVTSAIDKIRKTMESRNNSLIEQPDLAPPQPLKRYNRRRLARKAKVLSALTVEPQSVHAIQLAIGGDRSITKDLLEHLVSEGKACVIDTMYSPRYALAC